MTVETPYDFLTNPDEANKNPHRDYEKDEMVFLMSSVIGRRFVWRLLDKAGVYRTSFTGDNNTFFLEGQRNMGLFLLQLVNEYAVEQYALMLSENVKDG